MAVHRIKKGLDLPIVGEPQQSISDGAKVRHVAVLGADYVGMKPRMEAKVGDQVRRGQLLFEDRRSPGIRFTAPAAGTVVAVHRGDKRAFQALVIELTAPGEPGEQVSFQSYSGQSADAQDAAAVKALLQESGLWTCLRMRPFSRVPAVDSSPRALFVTAVDTNPHAPDVGVILAGNEDMFRRGLQALATLAPKVFVCKSSKLRLDTAGIANVQVEDFDGVHPAGNVGTHIHMLCPVDRSRVVWHIGYQDVIAVGKLFATGELSTDRVVALAGPVVQKPRLVRTMVGASLDDLTADELTPPPAQVGNKPGQNRVVSGSVLSGRTAVGEVHGYLGRYHNQVSALLEGRQRDFIGWLLPGTQKFSIIPVYFGFLARLFGKKFAFTTNTHGQGRAMVPIGMYERVMPLDIHPTFLLRSLLVGDTDRAIQLGALELDEEDLALCTFVDPGKANFGEVLRHNLSEIEKEG